MGSGREIKAVLRVPCEWCELVRDCDSEKRLRVKVRFICSRYDALQYNCPEHEPVWFKGIEGCAP